jgi:thioredoxin 1
VSRIVEVGADALRDAVASGDRVLVEFWASWCVQCGPMAVVVERLAAELPPDVRVLKVNVEQNEDAANEHGVLALPAILYFEGGASKTRIAGFKRLPLLVEALRPHLPTLGS